MQHNFHDRRNRYLYQLATLRQLADATGLELPQVVMYLNRLREQNHRRTIEQEANSLKYKGAESGVHSP